MLSGPGDQSSRYAGLGPLADNGGPTQTHALNSGGCLGDACIVPSSALDAGDNAACPAIDQRGFARPFDWDGNGVATCDIGAFEQHDRPTNQCTGQCPPGPATPSPSPSPDPSRVLPAAVPQTGGPPPDGGVPLAAPLATLPALLGAGALLAFPASTLTGILNPPETERP